MRLTNSASRDVLRKLDTLLRIAICTFGLTNSADGALLLVQHLEVLRRVQDQHVDVAGVDRVRRARQREAPGSG